MSVLNGQTSQKQGKTVSNIKITYNQEWQLYYIANNKNGKLIKFLPYKVVNN